jgi:hypothetical protein
VRPILLTVLAFFLVGCGDSGGGDGYVAISGTYSATPAGGTSAYPAANDPVALAISPTGAVTIRDAAGNVEALSIRSVLYSAGYVSYFTSQYTIGANTFSAVIRASGAAADLVLMTEISDGAQPNQQVFTLAQVASG